MGWQNTYRGARIEVQFGAQWEATVTMPGSILADPVLLSSDASAGIEDVVLQARDLVDQRIAAAVMTIDQAPRGAGTFRPVPPRAREPENSR